MRFWHHTAVLITGADSGIGRNLALQAAGRGALVFATDKNAAALEETKMLSQAAGHSLTAMPLDVADAGAVSFFPQQLVPLMQNRRLVLINNAGVGLLSGSFADTDLADFDWLLQTNLWGAIRLTKAFYPYLRQQNNGHIVNICSVFGLVGIEGQSAYCTAKFALRGFTETLRMELSGTGIKTTAVFPGGIATNIVRNARVKGVVSTIEAHQRSISWFEKNAATTPATAATLILNAVEKGKERLVIGSDGRRLDLLARLFPVAYTGLVKKKIEKALSKSHQESKQ